jgi:hypothetical protein
MDIVELPDMVLLQYNARKMQQQERRSNITLSTLNAEVYVRVLPFRKNSVNQNQAITPSKAAYILTRSSMKAVHFRLTTVTKSISGYHGSGDMQANLRRSVQNTPSQTQRSSTSVTEDARGSLV